MRLHTIRQLEADGSTSALETFQLINLQNSRKFAARKSYRRLQYESIFLIATQAQQKRLWRPKRKPTIYARN